jgi:membrane protein YqaA with SNARE-associated domain
MKKYTIPLQLRWLLTHSAAHRFYPLVVAAIAFIATVTFSFPFVVALIPAVLLGPKKWIVIGLLCGMASGCGAALLVEIFHHFGREVVLSRYPELVDLASWRWASHWLQSYGLIALLFIAASPMPQTPALFFCALAELSVPGVLVVVGLGKTAKYLFLAGATARYPYPARYLKDD